MALTPSHQRLLEKLSYAYFTTPTDYPKVLLESLSAHTNFNILSLVEIDRLEGQVVERVKANSKERNPERFQLTHFRGLIGQLCDVSYLLLDDMSYELALMKKRLSIDASHMVLFPLPCRSQLRHVVVGFFRSEEACQNDIALLLAAMPLLERAVAEEENILKRFFQKSFGTLLLVDDHLKVFEANDNALAFFEKEKKEDLLQWLGDEERGLFTERLQALGADEGTALTLSKNQWSYRFALRRLGKTPLFGVAIDPKPLDDLKTDLPKDLDLFEALLDLVPHHIYVKDDEGRIQYANTTHASYLDLERHELLGKKQRDLHRLMSGDIDRFTDEDNKILSSQRKIHLVDEEVVDNRGMTHYFETHKAPYIKDQERFVLGVSTEITDLVRHQNFLQKQKEELQHSYEDLESMNEELYSLNEELQDAYGQIAELYKESRHTSEGLEGLLQTLLVIDSSEQSLETFLKSAFRGLFHLIGAADCGSLLLFRNHQTHYIDAIGHDLERLKELHIHEDKFFRSQDILLVEDLLEKNVDNHFTSEEFEAMLRASVPIRSSLILSLQEDDDLVANVSLDISQRSEEHFTPGDKRIMEAFKQLVNAYLSQKRYRDLSEDFHKHTVLAINGMLEIHDHYTRGHSENVARLAQSMARALDLSEKEQRDAYWAGMVHDMGKILINGEVLNKPERLTPEEFDLIRMHPVWGYESLRASKPLEKIALYVRHHHERWDGGGYPDGLTGDEIPLISQILCIVDAFDAMISERSYRKAMPFTKGLEEIQRCAGSHFSPHLVPVFIDLLDPKS